MQPDAEGGVEHGSGADRRSAFAPLVGLDRSIRIAAAAVERHRLGPRAVVIAGVLIRSRVCRRGLVGGDVHHDRILARRSQVIRHDEGQGMRAHAERSVEHGSGADWRAALAPLIGFDRAVRVAAATVNRDRLRAVAVVIVKVSIGPGVRDRRLVGIDRHHDSIDPGGAAVVGNGEGQGVRAHAEYSVEHGCISNGGPAFAPLIAGNRSVRIAAAAAHRDRLVSAGVSVGEGLIGPRVRRRRLVRVHRHQNRVVAARPVVVGHGQHQGMGADGE